MNEKTIAYAENRAKAIDLLGGICVWCGTTEQLEFDHINGDRIDRSHKISALLLSSWNRVVEELEKCQLLCKDCHTVKTWSQNRVRAKHGSASFYINQKCRCDRCKAANAERVRKYRQKTNVV